MFLNLSDLSFNCILTMLHFKFYNFTYFFNNLTCMFFMWPLLLLPTFLLLWSPHSFLQLPRISESVTFSSLLKLGLPLVATISDSILPVLTYYLYLFPHYVLHYFREGKIALTICFLIAIFLNVTKYSSIQFTRFYWSPTLSNIIFYHCLFSSEKLYC